VARVIFTPPAKLLIRLGASADIVTLTGTALTVGSALWLLPTGHLWQAAVVLGALVCTDALDGTMARLTGTSTKWGAFLDSTLDRVADSAVFGGIVLYFAFQGEKIGATAALAALVLGTVVSYARARAEGLGLHATVGIAERSDRLILALVPTFITGVGASRWVLIGAMMLISLLSTITIIQRAHTVWAQGHDQPPGPPLPQPPARPRRTPAPKDRR
jgi:CDP-diacylglycerol--glycerol-3-phosphate 3-phosphatidyltransferase